MADSYRYRRSSRITQAILLPLLVLFLALFYRTIFPEEILEAGPLYAFVGFMLLMAYSYFILQGIREHTTQITLDSMGINIRDVFSEKKYKWHEITEYGMDDKGFGQFKTRNLYIKTTESGNRKIRIADRAIENVNDMSKKIIAAAVNSRILRTENISDIPFTKNYETSMWDGKI